MGCLVASTYLAGRPALRAIQYDGRGLRLRIVHASAGTRTAIYDARSRLVAYWDSRERIVRRTYDAIGRILTESVDGTIQETYHYDLVPDQMGRLGRVDDNAGSVSFSYDALGRVIRKTRAVLEQSFDIGYEYEPTGLQRRITYPDGSMAAFERGGDGRVQLVAGLVDEIDYDGTGRLSRIAHANALRRLWVTRMPGMCPRCDSAGRPKRCMTPL
jgi:YD repeat-containing protein